MKAVLLLTVLFSSSVFAYTTGDKILFQNNSTWISSMSKKICVGDGVYVATLSKCTDWGGREESSCRKSVTYVAYQPVNSTKQVCTVPSGRDQGGCRQWATVPFFQSPTRHVKYYDDNHDHYIKTVVMTVPDCK